MSIPLSDLRWQRALSRRKRFRKVCIECKKQFLGMTNQKVCSNKCRKERMRKNNLDNSKNRKGFYKLRFNIFERDSFKCIYCGRSSIEDMVYLEVEHINPMKGKKPDWNNSPIEELATSCKDCNQGKSDNILSLPILKRINEEILQRGRGGDYL